MDFVLRKKNKSGFREGYRFIEYDREKNFRRCLYAVIYIAAVLFHVAYPGQKVWLHGFPRSCRTVPASIIQTFKFRPALSGAGRQQRR